MPEPSAWRVDKRKWAASSFDGTGAASAGGRWNSEGVRVVYASAHLATAALEKFVHLPKPLPSGSDYVRFAIQFGRIRVQRLAPSKLPVDWMAEPVPESTQALGDAWVKERKTAILAVPSVLIPEETNYVLNPGHPDFSRLAISPPERFFFDPRLGRLKDSGGGARMRPAGGSAE